MNKIGPPTIMELSSPMSRLQPRVSIFFSAKYIQDHYFLMDVIILVSCCYYRCKGTKLHSTRLISLTVSCPSNRRTSDKAWWSCLAQQIMLESCIYINILIDARVAFGTNNHIGNIITHCYDSIQAFHQAKTVELRNLLLFVK